MTRTRKGPRRADGTHLVVVRVDGQVVFRGLQLPLEARCERETSPGRNPSRRRPRVA